MAMNARLVKWAPFIWAAPWLLADIVLRETTWLGYRDPGGLRDSYPALWLVMSFGVAALIGYRSLCEARHLRVARAFGAFACFLALFGGSPLLGKSFWFPTVITLMIAVFVLEIAAAVLEGRSRPTA